LLLAGLAAPACYRYVPTQLATAPLSREEDVRVRVTDAAAARLVTELGTYTTELDGRLARERSDSVSLSVAIARAYRGMLESARQVLVLSRSEVVEVRRRELSRTRTVLATAGALGAFGVLIRTVVQWGDPNPTSQGPSSPPPPSSTRRVVRVRRP
jgi:hypothetical protein